MIDPIAMELKVKAARAKAVSACPDCAKGWYCSEFHASLAREAAATLSATVGVIWIGEDRGWGHYELHRVN